MQCRDHGENTEKKEDDRVVAGSGGPGLFKKAGSKLWELGAVTSSLAANKMDKLAKMTSIIS